MGATEKVINLTIPADQDRTFCDLGQCLALLNKQQIRQGSAFMINEIRLNTFGTTESVTIHRLMENWVIANSHVKAMAEWNEQQIREADDAGLESFRAKWRDFKIYMNKLHYDDQTTPGTFDNNILPDNCTLAEIAAIPGAVEYEWKPSLFVLPNVTIGGTTATREYPLIAYGPDDPAGVPAYKSMVVAYAQSRARPLVPDPNVVTGHDGGLYTDMENVGEDSHEIIDEWVYNGNEPPYPICDGTGEEAYPGGEYFASPLNGQIIEAEATVSDNTRSLIPGFVAPVGLLQIKRDGDITQPLHVQIRMAAKPNGDILSIPMKELN